MKKKILIFTTTMLSLTLTVGFFLNLTTPCNNIALTQISENQCEALLDLYESTDGDNWYSDTNWLSDELPVSAWEGVTVENGLVVSVILPNNNLNGVIPSTISELSALRKINFSYNNISGHLPQGIGLLTNLEILSLDHNNLTGIIPESIINLVQIKKIDLKDNSLEMPLPYNLQNLHQLIYLDLSYNNLIGTLPNYFTSLLSLETLYLNNNQLSGELPQSLQNLHFRPSLRVLDLKNNEFTGEVPFEQGDSNSQLIALDISNNNFQSINENFSDLGHLEIFKASNNNFSSSSQVLSNVQALTQLKDLDLSNSQITENSNVIAQLPPTLTRLNLSNNELNGALPSGIGVLSNLRYLNLSGNNIVGTISSSIGNITNLQILNLQSNNLSGTIPSEIGDLLHLSYIFLNNNSFEGQIPASLFTPNYPYFIAHTYLNLSNNCLSPLGQAHSDGLISYYNVGLSFSYALSPQAPSCLDSTMPGSQINTEPSSNVKPNVVEFSFIKSNKKDNSLKKGTHKNSSIIEKSQTDSKTLSDKLLSYEQSLNF